jgi:hypothetical protein
MSASTKTEQPKETSQSRQSQSRLVILLVAVCFGVVLFSWIGYVAEEQNPAVVLEKHEVVTPTNDVEVRIREEDASPPTPPPTPQPTPAPTPKPTPAPTNSPTVKNVCPDVCKRRKDARVKFFGGDLLDRNALLGVAQNEKDKLIKNLHVDYGKENFENIFVDEEASGSEQRYADKRPANPDGNSTQTLKRKLMIKMLSTQISLAKKDAEASGCDCLRGETPLAGSVPNAAVEDVPIDDTYVRYVWATGGHSAAAGHGNLFNESYTAHMERDLKPFFASLGIDFEGRNYAMGGTRFVEASLCVCCYSIAIRA